MKKINKKILMQTIADVLTNLGAGWYGAIFIVPNFLRINIVTSIFILIFDLLLGTICIVIAYKLKEKSS